MKVEYKASAAKQIPARSPVRYERTLHRIVTVQRAIGDNLILSTIHYQLSTIHYPLSTI